MNEEETNYFNHYKQAFIDHLCNKKIYLLPKEHIESIVNMCFEASVKHYKQCHNNEEIPSELLLKGDSNQEHSMMYIFNNILEVLYNQVDLGVTIN